MKANTKKYITRKVVIDSLLKNYEAIGTFLLNAPPGEVKDKQQWIDLVYAIQETYNSIIKNNILKR